MWIGCNFNGPFKVSYFCKEGGELVHVEYYTKTSPYEAIECDAQTYLYGYTYKIEKY